MCCKTFLRPIDFQGKQQRAAKQRGCLCFFGK